MVSMFSMERTQPRTNMMADMALIFFLEEAIIRHAAHNIMIIHMNEVDGHGMDEKGSAARTLTPHQRHVHEKSMVESVIVLINGISAQRM